MLNLRELSLSPVEVKERAKNGLFTYWVIDIPDLPLGASYLTCRYYYTNTFKYPLNFVVQFEDDTAEIDCGNGYTIRVQGCSQSKRYRICVYLDGELVPDGSPDKSYRYLEEAAKEAAELSWKYVAKLAESK